MTNARGFDPDKIRREKEATIRNAKSEIAEADRRGQAAAREAEENRPGDDVAAGVTPEVVER